MTKIRYFKISNPMMKFTYQQNLRLKKFGIRLSLGWALIPKFESNPFSKQIYFLDLTGLTYHKTLAQAQSRGFEPD